MPHYGGGSTGEVRTIRHGGLTIGTVGWHYLLCALKPEFPLAEPVGAFEGELVERGRRKSYRETREGGWGSVRTMDSLWSRGAA